jgi:hypothetical protein
MVPPLKLFRVQNSKDQVPDKTKPYDYSNQFNHALKPPAALGIEQAKSKKGYCHNNENNVNHA